jgi:hypothetical protein
MQIDRLDIRLLRPDIARNRFESMEAAFPTVPSGIFHVDRIVRPVQDIPDFVRSTRQRSCAGSARRRSKPEMYGSGSGGFRYLPARRPTLMRSWLSRLRREKDCRNSMMVMINNNNNNNSIILACGRSPWRVTYLFYLPSWVGLC